MLGFNMKHETILYGIKSAKPMSYSCTKNHVRCFQNVCNLLQQMNSEWPTLPRDTFGTLLLSRHAAKYPSELTELENCGPVYQSWFDVGLTFNYHCEKVTC